MNTDNNILGCFVSGMATHADDNQIARDISEKKGKEFRSYIWGNKGISNVLSELNHKDYGKDLILILFQFYINPIPYLLENLKEIESYRKKEKSIGIPIIITDDNFFHLSEENRYIFLIDIILEKLILLAKVVNQKKLDTKLDVLTSDLKKLKLFPRCRTIVSCGKK